MTRRGVILLLSLLSAFSAVAQPSKAGKDSYIWYRVTRIVDGDTFWIDDGSPKGLKIRLIGIDAPEARNSGQKLKGFFGEESTEYITSLIGSRKVRLEYDVTRYDQYGRLLAYVYLDNGTFINAEMVKNGFATVMTFPPNVRYADTFVDLARKARKQNKGLWKNQ